VRPKKKNDVEHYSPSQDYVKDMKNFVV